MRILVIGSGAREHALVWKLSQSPKVEKLFSSPGNVGTSQIQKNENIDIAVDQIDALVAFASSEGIDLTIVGPEKSLELGIVDRFIERGLAIIGPTKQAAMLETSKRFAKEIMKESNIPTAAFHVFQDLSSIEKFISSASYPLVLKADGLSQGKGVAICANGSEAFAFARKALSGEAFGDAGKQIVIEEFLEGEEVSYFALCDDTQFVTLGWAQDHKRLLDGDRGPNTGGMGAYAPAPIFTKAIQQQVESLVVKPLLKAMAQRKTPYRGILFVGLMLTEKGPKVLEFNVRFGDPETQVILPILDIDLAELFLNATRHRLGGSSVQFRNESAMTVVMASKGYPEKPEIGKRVFGTERAQRTALVFHSGTRRDGEHIVTSGGRVLAITGLGKTLRSARDQAYEATKHIEFDGAQYRNDIGWRTLGK